MKCEKDGSEMKLTSQERKMPDSESMDFESLTEGQMADACGVGVKGDNKWITIIQNASDSKDHIS